MLQKVITMQFIIIIICALLSCTKVSIQGFVAKGNVKNISDSVFANCLVFAFTALIFSISLRNGINSGVIIYAVLFGIFSSSFQIFYALALQAGPFSATCMILNLNMLLPVTFSTLFFNEELTVTKLVGMFLCLFALFLNTRSDGRKINRKWIFYVAMAFFSTGAGISITQKIFAKSQYAANVEQFVFLGYLTAFLLTFILVLIQNKSRSKRNFKVNRKNMLLISLIALSLGAFQYFNTYASSFIDAIVLNPSISGLATTFQMLSGRIVFKERFTRRQLCSICVGILAILIISI